MKVLVTGDRNWTDKGTIHSVLSKLQKLGYTELIEGEARGADTIARNEALKLGYPIVSKYPAQWNRYGRGAGPIRNRQMLDEGKPDLVVWFHRNLAESKGTKDMVNYAISRGVHVADGSKEIR